MNKDCQVISFFAKARVLITAVQQSTITAHKRLNRMAWLIQTCPATHADAVPGARLRRSRAVKPGIHGAFMRRIVDELRPAASAGRPAAEKHRPPPI